MFHKGGFMVSKNNELSKLDSNYKDIVGNTAYNNKNVTIKSIVKDYSDKFDTLQVCFISDTHIGSSDFDIKGLVQNLKYADSQENAVIFFLGDGLNTAIVGSKSDTYEDVMNPQEQLDIFSKVLKLAKGYSREKLSGLLKKLNDSGKIVVVHSGNHEDRITKAVGISPTKIAADIAGVGDSFAPFFANTDLILRQPLSPDGKFHFGVVTHHGTGIKNIDGTFRLLRNIDNADMCVIGHTHQYAIKTDRTISVDSNGEQYYHDVICMSLPASGGGTYGAGMSLPNINKQSAVWIALSSQPNPHKDAISPTGIKQRAIVPACAFFSPTNSIDANIEAEKVKLAENIITQKTSAHAQNINKKIADLIGAIKGFEKDTREEIVEKIADEKLAEPEGFLEYFSNKNKSNSNDSISSTDKNEKELGE